MLPKDLKKIKYLTLSEVMKQAVQQRNTANSLVPEKSSTSRSPISLGSKFIPKP